MSTKFPAARITGIALALVVLSASFARPLLALDEQQCEDKFDFANGLLNGNQAAGLPPSPAKAVQNETHDDYLTIIQDCPTFSKLDLVYNNLAIAYQMQNQMDKVASTLSDAVKRFPQSTRFIDWLTTLSNAELQLADQANKNQDTARARAYYSSAIGHLQTLAARAPDRDTAMKARFAMGNAEFNIGDYAGAASTYSQLMAQNPPAAIAAPALFNEGNAYLNLAGSANDTGTKSQNFDRAAQALNSLITTYPRDTSVNDARLVLGKVYFQNKQFPQAASMFSALSESAGATTAQKQEALNDLIYAEVQAGQFSNAIAAGNRYVQQFPRTPDTDKANVELGYLYHLKSTPPNLSAAATAYRAAAGSQDAATSQAAQEGEIAVAVDYVKNQQDAQALPIYSGLTGSALPRVRMDALYGKAITMLNLKDPGAQTALAGFIQAYPNSPGTANAAYQLGVLQYGAKQYTQAERSFAIAGQTADTLEPNATSDQRTEAFNIKTEALYWAGTAAMSAGQPQTAVQDWAQEVAADPGYKSSNTADALMSLGRYYLGQNQSSQAAHYFQLALTNYPNDPRTSEALLTLGAEAMKAGDFRSAINDFQQLAAAQPKSEAGGNAEFNTGLAYLQMKPANPGAAAQAFGRYLASFPTGKLAARAAFNRARALEMQGAGSDSSAAAYLPQAITAYRQVITLAPSDTDPADKDLGPQAALKLAMDEAQLKQTAQAEQDLQTASQQFGSSPAAQALLFQEGVIYQSSGQSQLALTRFKEYLQRYPNGADAPAAHFNAAVIQYNMAVSELAASNKETDQTRSAALLSQARQHYAAASADFETALANPPQGAPWVEQAYYYEGWAFANTDQPAKAAEAFRTMLARFPNSQDATRARLRLGMAEATTNPQDAVRQLRQYLASANNDPKDPDVINANLALGQAEIMLGDYNTGQADLDKVINNTDAELAAAATYYKAFGYEKQGDKPRALLTYQKVILVYGAATQWVNQAKTAIARLNAGGA